MSRPLAIAFLACNKNPDRFLEDASFLYRCQNLALALAQLGHAAQCEHVSRWSRRTPVDVVVLHRPMFSWALWRLLGWLKRQGVRVVMDVDDLVFDPALAALSPAVLNAQTPLALVAWRFAMHRQALRRADVITTSTLPLQQELQAMAGLPDRTPVHWIPNAVHHRWRQLSPAATWQAEPPRQPVVRYLPGTRSHDRDFAEIAPILAQVLQARPEVRLEIVGPLTCALPLPEGQWHQLPKLPFDRYHEVVRGASVNLAPLEPTRFTRCKSALKVMEAAFWGVPTLCSPSPDHERLREAGALVCESSAQWQAQLGQLLDDPAGLRQRSAMLRPAILQHADVGLWAQRWLDLVQAMPVSGWAA